MSLTGYLLNSLWQFPAIVLATWVLIRLLARRDPLLRYRLWFAGLVLSVILPACPRPELPNALSSQVQVASHEEQALQHAGLRHVRLFPTALFSDSLLCAFVGAALFGFARLLFGFVGTFHMARFSSPASLSSATLSHYEATARRLGLTSSPSLRVQARVYSPATAGWRKPLILLPSSASSWNEGDLSAALSHELVHVVRNDFFWNIVSRSLLLPLLYNPLSWWLRRQLEVAREMVCDEQAAALSENRQAYAEALLSMGRASFRSSHGLALNWYTEHPLEERIMQLLSSTAGKQANRWSLPLSMATLSGLAFALTLGSSLSAHAQSTTASIVPAAASAPLVQAAQTPHKPLAIAKGAQAHVRKQRGTFEHQWKAADGDNVVILTQSPEPPSAEERERVEKTIQENKFTLGSMSSLLNDKTSKLDFKDMEERIHTAELALNDAKFQKTMSDFQRQMNDGTFQRKLKEAETALQNARKQ